MRKSLLRILLVASSLCFSIALLSAGNGEESCSAEAYCFDINDEFDGTISCTGRIHCITLIERVMCDGTVYECDGFVIDPPPTL